MFQYIVFIGTFLQMTGIFFYIKDTLKGKNKPNRVSWLIWAASPIISTMAALSDGVGLATLPVFAAGFGPLLVLIASFVNKKSYWELEIYDYLCGGFSVLALILWWITKEPSIAILFALISDGFASIPTVIKSWKNPETETVSTYILGLCGVLTSFLVLKTFSFSELAFPCYLVFIDSLLIILILRIKIRNLFIKPQ